MCDVFPFIHFLNFLPRTPSVEVLRELIDSRYTVYDVLPTFFDHEEPWVSLGGSFLHESFVQ
jgi:hypothetical protein